MVSAYLIKTFGIGVFGLALVGRGAIAEPFPQKIAQTLITPDSTLGEATSLVVPLTADTDGIGGGFIDASSLFHSFQDFSIAEGRSAYFFSPSEDILNIFSRVTGNTRSDIFGTLGTYGNSSPNLWLMNPNGILFGPNARLDLGGSFVATTANAIQIDATPFFASEVTEGADVLTINNSVFAFNQNNSGNVISQARTPLDNGPVAPGGLSTVEGQSLGLVGKGILVEGGELTASNGFVGLFAIDDIELNSEAAVVAGTVSTRSQNLFITEGAQLLSDFVDPRVGSADQPPPPIEGGNLFILASNLVEISGTGSRNSQQASRVGSSATGFLSSGANISLQSSQLNVQEGGLISSTYHSRSSQNQGGSNITIDAAAVNIDGTAADSSIASSVMVGGGSFSSTASETDTFVENAAAASSDGNIFINADTLRIAEGAKIILNSRNISSAAESPAPESIRVSANDTLIDGTSSTGSPSAILLTGTRDRNGSSFISVDASNLSIVDGALIDGSLINLSATNISLRDNSAINTAASFPFNANDLGVVNVVTSRLALQDDAQINSELLTVSATEQLSLSGNATINDSTDTRAFTAAETIVNLSAQNASVSDDAIINGDDIALSGRLWTIQDQAQVLANRAWGGSSGRISAEIDTLQLLDSAQLSASVGGIGRGGSVEIAAQESVVVSADRFSERPSAISAVTEGPGTGGRILIETENLSVQNGAQITTNVGGGGNGGNITIVATESAVVEGRNANGIQSRISSESDLNGGEFGILRSIKRDATLLENINMMLSTAIEIYTRPPSRIISTNREVVGREGAPAIQQVTSTPDADFLPEGSLLVGQSFSPGLSSSIEGGQIVTYGSLEELNSARSLFLSSFSTIEQVLLEALLHK